MSEQRAWFEWNGKRYEAVRVGESPWIIACPECGDGVVFSHNDTPHDENWLPHQVTVGADGALTCSPSVVCSRCNHWHVVITNGRAA